MISQFSSGVIAWIIVIYIKYYTFEGVTEVYSMISKNWRVSLDNYHVSRALMICTRGFKCLALCCFIIAIIIFITIEFEECDLVLEPFSCGYILPSYYFVNLKRPFRDIVNACVAISYVYICLPIVNALWALLLIMKYVEVTFNEMAQQLRELKFISDWDIRNGQLIDLYNLQLFITRLWNTFNDLYKLPISIHIFSCSSILSMSIISTFMAFNIMAIVLICIFSGEIILFGLIGEKLSEINERYRNEIYFACPWDGDVKSSKHLMLMHLNSNDIIMLKIGTSLKYSNTLVYKLFKLAYSMITMFSKQR